MLKTVCDCLNIQFRILNKIVEYNKKYQHINGKLENYPFIFVIIWEIALCNARSVDNSPAIFSQAWITVV